MCTCDVVYVCTCVCVACGHEGEWMGVCVNTCVGLYMCACGSVWLVVCV